jgi:very-short-patch-repair endonuclease
MGYDKAPSGAVDRARELRRNATDAEKRLWRALREAFPGAKFRRQTPVGPYIADFLSFRRKLIIEADGGQHTPEIDAARTRYLEREGYTVLRFWNNDVLSNTEGVIATVSLSLREREGASGTGSGARKGEGERPSPATHPHPPTPLRGAGPSLTLRERV